MATLLTGVGYIGAAVLSRLAEQPAAQPIVAIDDGSSTPRQQVLAALPVAARLIEGDVADPATVARAFEWLRAGAPAAPEVTVYHLAAQPSAGVAAREPERTERSNLVGARVVLEAARVQGARVVFGSSFRVYGDDLVGRTVDEDTPYGRVGDLSHLSKVYVEQLVRMLGVRCVSVRLGVTYGVSPIMKTAPEYMTVPNLFCQRATRGEPLRVLEDRPMAFIHVEDAADALLLAAGRHGPTFEIVNAAPEVASVGQVARGVQRLARQRGLHVEIQGAATSEASFGVASRLEHGGGFRARHTLDDSLGDVLDWFMAAR